MINVRERLIHIIQKHLCIVVDDENNTLNDYGADSLDIIMIATDVELEFEISIDDMCALGFYCKSIKHVLDILIKSKITQVI